MSLSRSRVGLSFNRTVKGQGSQPNRMGRRPAPQTTNVDWTLTTTISTEQGDIDYFGKYKYESSTIGWRPRDGVWIVDEKPPTFWVFHPPQATSFKFDLFNSDANWTKGSLVASSGWQKSAIWYPDPSVSLTGTHYLLEVKCKTGSFTHRLVGDNAIRVLIPSDTPTVERIKATALRSIFETYPSQTIETGMVRRSVLGRLLNSILDKYNQAAANPTAYPITYHVIARQIGNEWHSTTHRLSKTKIQALCDRQVALETAVDTNDPNYTDPTTSDPYLYIFDMRGQQNNSRAMIYPGAYYEGFPVIEQHLNFLAAVAAFHPSPSERQEAYHLFRIFVRTLIERVWTNNRGETLSSHERFSKPDNASFAIGAMAVFYDLLYSQFIESDSFTIRLFGEEIPIRKAIPVFLKSYLEQRYFTSKYYLYMQNDLPFGIYPEEIASLRPFESHRHRNHRTYFLVMLILNQLLGWDNWTERIQRELDRLYATSTPWSISDFGYNEGCSYLLSYLGNLASAATLLQAAGVPCHQIRRSDRCAWDLMYTGPYGTQEWSAGDSNFTRPPLYDPHNWASLHTFIVASRFIAGTSTQPGTPEARIFRTYATSNNFQGCHTPQTVYADRLPNLWLPILLTPTVNDMIESPAPTEPLESAPEYLISKVTKIAHIPTDFRSDQQTDTASGKPKMIVRFYGQRLLRQSHMRNSANDLQIVAGGEHIIGHSMYGYGYGSGFYQEWATSSLPYTPPLVLPQNASYRPDPNTEPVYNQWHWETARDGILVRESQIKINKPPCVSLLEMLSSTGVYTYGAQTISRWVYLENDARERYAGNRVSACRRRVVVMPDFPLVVVLDEVQPTQASALLWSWYGWSFQRHLDPNIQTGMDVDRNLSPFISLGNNRWRVRGCRAGSNYRFWSNPTSAEHNPRMSAVFGGIGDPSVSGLFLAGRAHRPFETNTIYRKPGWTGSEFQIGSSANDSTASVPHPLGFWTTTNPNSTHMNDSVGFVPANTLYRAAFWCVPYRIRTTSGSDIPNADADNDWIAVRRDDRDPTEIQIGVFNNAPSAKYGVVVKFKKSGYTESNAVSFEYIPNQSAWDSFLSTGSG